MSGRAPGELYDALRRRAALFAEAGLVDDADLRIAVALGGLGEEERVDVLLALALVIGAPRRGDTALDLERTALPAGHEGPAGAAWLDLVCTSALVAGPAPEPRAPFVVHGGLLYARRAFEQERRLADAFLARAAAGLADLDGEELPLDALATRLRRLFPREGGPLDRQALAVATGALRLFTVIVGGPGTGKTYTIRALLAVLLDLARERGAPLRVALAAPTGKAAARITQAIGEGLGALDLDEATRAELASLEARTLHRLLGRRPGTARLPYDVVVVDEASMVDLAMMSRLVEALRADTRLVLLGDRHQLASVEAGAVLADLVPPAVEGAASRLTEGFARKLEAALGEPLGPREGGSALAECVVHLERPRRFDAGGPVGRLARFIAEGTPDAIERALTVFDEPICEGAPSASMLAHGRLDGLGPAALERLAARYRSYLDLLERGPAEDEPLEAFHARVLIEFDAYRVLCVHRVGPFGAEEVARALEAALIGRRRRGRPDADEAWLGKPVLIVRNSYDTRLFNGDVGVVVGRGAERVVAFSDGARGGVRYLRPERLPPHELALATTVHKAQGSQVDHVALVLPGAPSAVLTRELVYTAITRARRSVTVAGDRATLRLALERPTARASGLGEMLWAAPALAGASSPALDEEVEGTPEG